MEEGQHSMVSGKYSVMNSVALWLPVPTLLKKTPNAINSNIWKHCFLFSMSMLYLKSSSEEWHSFKEGR